ncbi:MBL fold metallo-hydrolase [Actinobacteria bacterium YIM 96077]|uniref:MBL fold metallo-hydrolase n=1 Tax=Phytoactinopolyspora halophila TaxID=1981511 RepID=A0A329QA59_9ACTN|nr:MBL fold metallo-hydrolase [Actinobacteria bacterium YIM 96077]RAW09300.1 MBL fold metallo-hydrolase [Phytoactinopolyspora halophila]
MSYTGHVDPGGTPAVHELSHLIVTKLSVGGSWNNNAYVLRCRETGEEVLVDAADEPERILAVCGEGPLTTIVTTHRHRDHWRALADVVAATNAETVAHVDDAPAIPVPTSRNVRDGDLLRFGRCELEVIHLVGHTPGSIALLYDDPKGSPHLWTGDSLFPGGVGKTASPADFASLIDDVERKLFERLPDETWVYPGHGDDTTLGRERPQLGEWRRRGW